MKILVLSILAVTLMDHQAGAIECKGVQNGHQIVVSVAENGALTTLSFDTKVQDIETVQTYDGHSNYQLITGKGVSFTYDNEFGCIRNANLMSGINFDPTNESFSKIIGKVNFQVCSGGQSPDSICK